MLRAVDLAEPKSWANDLVRWEPRDYQWGPMGVTSGCCTHTLLIQTFKTQTTAVQAETKNVVHIKFTS
jgi:hypothetical protein